MRDDGWEEEGCSSEAEAVLDAARRWCDRQELRYRDKGDRLVFGWTTQHGPVSTTIYAVEEERVVHVSHRPLVRIPAAARGRVAELLARIGWELGYASQELDFGTGRLRVRRSSFVAEENTPRILGTLVHATLDLLVDHLPVIYAVAFGSVAPEEGLAGLREAQRREAAQQLN